MSAKTWIDNRFSDAVPATRLFADLLTTYLAIGLILVVLTSIALLLIDPTPPKIVVATGLNGGVYQDFALRYKAILARQHIDLDVQPSAGSMQNLHRLSAEVPDADIAFIQSGTSNDEIENRRGLVSLGSLFVEPIWVFYRDDALQKAGTKAPSRPGSVALVRYGAADEPGAISQAISRLEQLRGLSMNVGPVGSGGPRLARQLLAVNNLGANDVALSNFDDASATEMLLAGSIDAVMFITAPDAPLVQKLLGASGVRLMSFAQAEAYARRFPFLKHVVLPQGIVAFDRNIPRADVELIAPTATLVAKSNTHPALIELLMQAVTEVHGGPSWFGRAGEFPNDQYTEVPVSPIAERYYKSGPPFLQRYLPFRWANLFERMGLVIVPTLALLIPLSHILSPLYRWRARAQINRWYGGLRDVENSLDVDAHKDSTNPARHAHQLAELTAIESKVNLLVVPLAYANELYALKLHIDRVRKTFRLGEAAARQPATSEQAFTRTEIEVT